MIGVSSPAFENAYETKSVVFRLCFSAINRWGVRSTLTLLVARATPSGAVESTVSASIVESWYSFQFEICAKHSDRPKEGVYTNSLFSNLSIKSDRISSSSIAATIRFHGVVNENAAEGTNLSPNDVTRLDNTVWRALKNQTLTRSKMGHNPRLYLRVEYDGNYYEGNLDELVSIDEEQSKPDREMRSIADVTISVDQLVGLIKSISPDISKVHIIASKYTTFSYDGETMGHEGLYDALSEYVEINEIDMYS